MESRYFKEITIKGFRRLRHVELPLKRLNVVIGANGSGKTSLLDVLSLLASSAAGDLEQVIGGMGGISPNISNLTSSPDIGGIRFTLSQAQNSNGFNPLDYQLVLKPQGVGYGIELEELSQDQGRANPFLYITCHQGNAKFYDTNARRLKQPDWEYNSSESALSQVPKMYDAPSNFRRDLACGSPGLSDCGGGRIMPLTGGPKDERIETGSYHQEAA